MSLDSQIHQSEKDLDSFLRAKFADLDWQIYALFRNIKLATLWYRQTKNEKGILNWEFNHLEDGHCPNSFPTPKHDIHKKVWVGGKWAKVYVQLRGDSNTVEHYLITKD